MTTFLTVFVPTFLALLGLASSKPKMYLDVFANPISYVFYIVVLLAGGHLITLGVLNRFLEELGSIGSLDPEMVSTIINKVSFETSEYAYVISGLMVLNVVPMLIAARVGYYHSMEELKKNQVK